MIRWRSKAALLATATLAACLARDGSSPAQAPAAPAQPTPGRFEFLIVESFDARYLGDTPGHMGRASLGRNAPRLALGDPVFRDAVKVGRITHLSWNEARESLDVEFDPLKDERIAIGDAVWVALGRAP